ncbi:MAG: proteasome subunit beta, partial [Acidimicrobiia bacterium]
MFDSPLPTFATGRDPGASFVDLLRQIAPHELATGRAVSESGPTTFDLMHGTTVLAIRYDGGVVMAGDRRATAGMTIANRR